MKKTALHNKHLAHGAKMVEFAGYEMPVSYAGIKQEHAAVRDSVGVFDVSHMGEFFVSGPKAKDLIDYISSNDVTKLVPGKAQYSCFPNDKGGIVDDLIVYMLKENHYMLVVNGACMDKDWAWVNKQNEQFGATLDNRTDDLSLLAVQGPNANKVLQQLTQVDLESIPFYHFTVDEFAGQADVIISNTGYTGSGGFELYVPNQYAEAVWDAVMEKGKDYGIEPCGLGSRDTLRLEMGYCLYGNDITDETSPLEAGLGWITKLKKEADFVAKDLLAAQKEAGVSRKLVAIEMIEKGIPRNGYTVEDENGQEIGFITSGTQSPSLQKSIALGYVTIENSKLDTQVRVVVRNKKVLGKVVKLPFYKPKK